MGKKKGKSKGPSDKQEEENEAVVPVEEMVKEEEGATSVPTPQPGGRKGKKGRKKNVFEEEWDEDLASIAAEAGIPLNSGDQRKDKIAEEGEGTRKEEGEGGKEGTGGNEGEKATKEGGQQKKFVSDEAAKQPAPATEEGGEGGGGGGGKGGGGKKSGKKKRKKDQADWENDIELLAREIEGPSGVVSGHSLQPTVQASDPQQPDPPQDQLFKTQENAKEEKKRGREGGEEEEEGVEEEEEEEGGRSVKTKSEKKAAKKEREKRKRENLKQKGKGAADNAIMKQQSMGDEKENTVSEGAADAEPSNNEPRKSVAEGGDEGGGEENGGQEEEEGEEGDDKKKKKKKKKKAVEEEKKVSKGKKPAKSAILKMKEQIEMMRAEQRRREEEELVRQKAEEEAERKREELARLEEEKKERRKQKEKERRERRKAEGKPVTKAERERYAKAQARLQAMEEKGLIVPARTTEKGEGGGTKGKVRYGGRQRNKKKLQTAEEEEGKKMEEEETEEDEMKVEGERAAAAEEEGEEKTGEESWEDILREEGEEEQGNNVKERWDEEEDKVEEQDKPAQAVKQDSPVQPSKGTSAVEDGEREEEGEEKDEEEESSEESSNSEDEELTPYQKAKQRIETRRERHKEEMSLELLRSPVVCVLGHVDTGKTKILDKIRHTNVQDGEAGGITQQIGATFVPEDAIRTQTKMIKEFAKTDIKLPGLLIIDTPGHESFSNLRTRGSSMCDLAILVVDIMHGLEPQTLESINILRKGSTPYIVALNKIDRLFDWRRLPTSSVREAVKKQKQNTKDEFDERVRGVVTEFSEQGINVALFWEKVDFKEYVPLVPTSAHTGDGIGDFISLLVTYSQKVLAPKLMLSQEVEAVVLEVKVIAGLGTTVDVILRNGALREGDTLVLTGTEGPFSTQVRALLMPQPLRELRVKNAYVNHKAIIASQGVKITAKDLEKTLAGTPVFVAKKADEVEVLKDEAASVMKSALSSIQLQERGVYVQASTLGSLEALLVFLKQSNIPYSGVNIGPVHKRDVMKASVMLERDTQWAVILAFDVRVEREAQEMADSAGVRIFTADIIYHLFDNFLKHRKELRDQKRREFESVAIFPCKLRILPNCVFNTRDPIVVGVVVEAGLVKRGTILTVPTKSFIDIGVITSLEVNHKQVDIAHCGEEVCIKVEASGGEAPRLYGRHFDHTDMLVSKISRESIDVVKNYFREDLQKSDWQLFIELKKVFHII